MDKSNKLKLAEEKVLLARMVNDFGLYSAQDVFEKHLEQEEFVTQDGLFSLKYISLILEKVEGINIRMD